MKKIILLITLLFLLVGAVSAFDVDDFKVPDYFGDLNGGQSINEIDSSIQFYIYDFDAADYQSDNEYDVTHLENDTYKVYDKTLQTTGIQEKVTVDGKDFTVYLFGKTDFENLEGYLSQFNELNDVEPIAV